MQNLRDEPIRISDGCLQVTYPYPYRYRYPYP